MAGFDKILGKYLLKSQLGHGGMGVVYLATDTRLKRDVALKLLPRQLSTDKEAVARFMQEARVVAQLNHPNVVIVHDVDQERGYCYLVMELLTGGTMQDVLQRGPLSWSEATNVVVQTCRGLAAAQAAGLIHRDIKPSNIMKAASGIVKLTDFGLAKVVEEVTNVSPLTKTGTIMGTPQYMSPEQCRGELLDGRSDLYALGATYFALLVGKPPFVEADLLQIMFAHCSRPVPDPCSLRADIPTECGQIVLKAMAKNRADRFASAKEMVAALDQVLAKVPTMALPPPMPNPDGMWLEGGDLAPTVKYSADAVPVATVAPAVESRKFNRRGIALIGGACSLLLLMAIVLATWNPFRKADEDKLPAGENQTITLEPSAELPVGKSEIRSAAFAPDGSSLFTGTLAGSVEEWDVAKKAVRRKFTGTKERILAVAVYPHWLAAGGHAKTLWLWKLDAEKPHSEIAEHAGEISALAFSPDGRYLAVGTYSEVRLYTVSDKGAKLVKVLATSTAEPVTYMVMSVAFSSDSRSLAATTWTPKCVHVWSTADAKLRVSSPQLAGEPMAVAFVPGQDRLVIGVQSKGVFVWEPGQAVLRRGGSDKPTRALAVTADGKTAIVIGEWGGTIRLVDLDADAPAQAIQRSTGTGAIAIALSANGNLLATGGGDDHPGRSYLHLLDVTRRKPE